MSNFICPIPGCRRHRLPDHYLCQRHWFMLPEQTRKSLWLKDKFAADRLKLLVKAAIRERWPLGEILIADDPETGLPRLWRTSEAPVEVLSQ